MWDDCAVDPGLEVDADKTQMWGRDEAAERELRANGFEVTPTGVVLGGCSGKLVGSMPRVNENASAKCRPQ
eukprot:7457068-Alexandrium_andersonii.AAC.1